MFGYFYLILNPKYQLMKPLTYFFIIIFTSFSFAQQTSSNKTIEESIDSIYNISSSWEFYKIIKKDRYLNLKKEILDSLNVYKSDIKSKSKFIQKQQDSILKAKKVIDDLSFDLKLSLDKRNEISFFGISLSKTVYQFIVWGIIIGLLFILIYYIYRFNNSHSVTRNAQNELANLEEEFAAHKKKAMEKEQKLRRQLQDEINKQRGV